MESASGVRLRLADGRELIDAMEDNFSKWKTREGIRDLPELDSQRDPGSPGPGGGSSTET